jgi:hypothetical protein
MVTVNFIPKVCGLLSTAAFSAHLCEAARSSYVQKLLVKANGYGPSVAEADHDWSPVSNAHLAPTFTQSLSRPGVTLQRSQKNTPVP